MATISKGAESNSAGTGGMFLRKATGLVRDVSVWDAIVLNSSGMNVGVGVALLFLWGAQMPGASILGATIICTVFVALTTAYNYAAAAGAFPRSGADYVFTSRVLGPVWGFMLSGQQVIWNFFWMAFNAWAMANFALPGTLQLLGEFTQNQGLIDLAGKVTNAWAVVGIAVVLQILFAALHISGIKNYFAYMKITFAICAFSVFVSIGVLLFGGANFQANWNAIMTAKGGLTYQGVIDAAKAAGFDPNAPFNLGRTLALMPMVFWIVGFFNGSPQIGGEVKKARSTQFTSMVVATLFNGGVVALLAILVNQFIGSNFLNSLGYLYFNNPAVLNLGVAPDFNFLVNVIARSTPVAALMGLAYVLWATNGTPNIIAFVTRSILAYSFDRMAPESLGEVSEKTLHAHPGNYLHRCDGPGGHRGDHHRAASLAVELDDGAVVCLSGPVCSRDRIPVQAAQAVADSNQRPQSLRRAAGGHHGGRLRALHRVDGLFLRVLPGLWREYTPFAGGRSGYHHRQRSVLLYLQSSPKVQGCGRRSGIQRDSTRISI